MSAIINELLANVISGFFSVFDACLHIMLDGVLHFETLIASVVTQAMITAVYNQIYIFALSMLGIKFLFKGFQIYILWRDGDADCSPQNMLIGAGAAVFMMIGFPVLYEMMASITLSVSKTVLKEMELSDSLNFDGFNAPNIFDLVTNIVIIVYVVMLLVLFVEMLKHGAGLLAMRIALPFMSLGLIDSDLGAFRPFMQKFYKAMMTCVIQISFFSLSLRVAIDFSLMQLILAIVLASAAFSTPAMLQEWTVQTRQGQPISTKIYQGAQLGRVAASFLK